MASSAMTLVLAACVFQACGGTEAVNKDGGGDGSDQPDTGMNPDGTVADTGDMDTGMTDTGVIDSGPNCTNMPCVIGLAVGGRHACALINDGTVRCWGDNARGQLGTNDGGPYNAANRPSPLQVDGLTGIKQVAATTSYATFGATCALTGAGGVMCLGSNGASQLGLTTMNPTEDNNPHSTPAAVAGLPMSTMTGVATYIGCASTNAGEYWCWGDNNALMQINNGGLLGRGGNTPPGAGAPGAATLLSDAGGIKAGSPGTWFNLALASNGTIYSWGNNQLGSLGRMTSGNDDPIPAPVGNVTNATQLSAGELHACAVAGGQVFCWGENDSGQLGRGLVSNNGSSTAVAVPLPGNKNASQVACSNSHTCALATDGSVYCWGRNNAGQVGPNGMMNGYNPAPVTQPQQVMLPAKALAIGTGGNNGLNAATGSSCALLDGGNVYCWGHNGDGQLGRSGDAGGTITCANNLPGGCSPNPAAVVWQ